MFIENFDKRALFIIGIVIVLFIIAKIIGKAVKFCIALLIVAIILSLIGFIDLSTFLSKQDSYSNYLCEYEYVEIGGSNVFMGVTK